MQPEVALNSSYRPNEYQLIGPDTVMWNYIGGPDAWGISKGASTTVIGITDNYFDTSNIDLHDKLVAVRYNSNPFVSHPGHGTFVAGLAGGVTDNNYAFPSMGFNCNLDVSTRRSVYEILSMVRSGDRVVNASWYHPGWSAPTLDLDTNKFVQQQICNEIYERGGIAVFGAGNDYSEDPHVDWYEFPSSFNHNLSITNVGWKREQGTSNVNVVDIHEINIGDDTNTSYHHNRRVDLCAPAYEVNSIYFDPNDSSKHYTSTGRSGTSFAAPLVAGTVGLMLSENPCLTPYQVEYILKKSAKNIYSITANQKYNTGSNFYNGELGAGKMETGVTLINVKEGKEVPSSPFNCNNPTTKTFAIQGIQLNTICKPGSASNGVKPKLVPIVENGTPPYTYKWTPMYNEGNSTILNNYGIAEPTIDSSWGNNIAYYALTVYDNSEIQKVADKVFRILLTDENNYILAMQDNYMDVMDEPNSMTELDPMIWDVWSSPDAWNRKHDDNGITHQNPEYYTTDSNYAYVRIHNIGCATSPNHYPRMKLYWTKASTGEGWPDAWVNLQIPGAGGSLVTAGGEITPVGGMYIPVLAPGGTTLMSQGWRPVNPHLYLGSPDNVDVCLLARIETSYNSPYGMTIPEGNYISDNIRNNNKIVSRNMILTDLYPGNLTPVHWVDFANFSGVQGVFQLELINDKTINPITSGDFSAVGYVEVFLGDLYNRWVASGGSGTYTAINSEQRSVTFGGGDPLRLNNIMLNANERFPIKLVFHLRSGVILNENDFLLHLRQYDQSKPNTVYGAVNFLIKTHPRLISQNYLINDTSTVNGLKIFPNPASEKLFLQLQKGKERLADIRIYDVYGRELIHIRNQKISISGSFIDISALSSGTYFITVVYNKGENDIQKFVKE